MTQFARFRTVLFTLALAVPLPALCDDAPATAPATQPATDQSAELKELRAKIDEGIALLDKKDIDAFFDRFVEPDLLAKWKANPDEFAKIKATFATDKADAAEKGLKECQAEDPQMLTDDEASFATTALHGRPMKFKKVDGKWYIKDR